MSEHTAIACLILWINGAVTIPFVLCTFGIDDKKITWWVFLYLLISGYIGGLVALFGG